MKITITFEERYGYHIIDTTALKVKFAPKLKTDECLHLPELKEWSPVDYQGAFHDGYAYRRKVQVPEGYRLLGPDEVMRQGDVRLWKNMADDVVYSNGDWTPRRYNNEHLIAVFRPLMLVLPKTEDGWIPLTKDSLPKDEDYPVWVTDGKDVHHADEWYVLGHEGAGDNIYAGWPKPPVGVTTRSWDALITHWKPKEKTPTPPKPKVKPEDEAFEKAIDQVKKDMTPNERTYMSERAHFRTVFNAGRAYEKGRA